MERGEEGGCMERVVDKSFQRFFGDSFYYQRLGSACSLVNLCSKKIIGNETMGFQIMESSFSLYYMQRR